MVGARPLPDTAGEDGVGASCQPRADHRHLPGETHHHDREGDERPTGGWIDDHDEDQRDDMLLAACDRTNWTGRRDHTMLVLAIQTGLRISELTALTLSDVTLGTGAHVHTIGKGRKERRTPLLPLTVNILKAWLAERGGIGPEPLFPTITGQHLSRDAVEHRIALHVAKARTSCPSLRTKTITTHTLRHTAAMRLLLSGVDVTVIALWLGHEQVSTTNIYLHADMTQKERAIARVSPPATKPVRYLAPDSILAFLDAL